MKSKSPIAPANDNQMSNGWGHVLVLPRTLVALVVRSGHAWQGNRLVVLTAILTSASMLEIDSNSNCALSIFSGLSMMHDGLHSMQH
jgi:hypothetical protein